ncbi:MAG: hypothetical protein AAGP08_12700 [Pseudomonadota bacterium]
MFRLIRLPILLCLAFGAGYVYAEIDARDRCSARGGTMDAGLCVP